MSQKEYRLSLDRFEGDIAVCIDENERVMTFARHMLDGIAVGDTFLAEFDSDGSLIITDTLRYENEQMRRDLEARLSSLFKKNRK